MAAVRRRHHEIAESLAVPAADPNDPFGPPRVRLSRPRGGSIRRDFGIRPAEAEAIARVADDLGVTPSAYMRLVLSVELSESDL